MQSINADGPIAVKYDGTYISSADVFALINVFANKSIDMFDGQKCIYPPSMNAKLTPGSLPSNVADTTVPSVNPGRFNAL